MYKSPFGSLFSSNDSTPKLDPKPIDKPLPSDALGKRTAELKKSKVIDPNIKSLETKKPFDNTTPQFKSLTTMRSDDMRVIAEQSKILVEKNKQKLAALSRRLSEIKLKIRGAKVYRDVLIQFKQLPEVDKQILAGWVLKHSVAIKKLNSAKKLSIIKRNAKESVQALDAEIMHWGNLLQLKKEGLIFKERWFLKATVQLKRGLELQQLRQGSYQYLREKFFLRAKFIALRVEGLLPDLMNSAA